MRVANKLNLYSNGSASLAFKFPRLWLQVNCAESTILYDFSMFANAFALSDLYTSDTVAGFDATASSVMDKMLFNRSGIKGEPNIVNYLSGIFTAQPLKFQGRFEWKIIHTRLVLTIVQLAVKYGE